MLCRGGIYAARNLPRQPVNGQPPHTAKGRAAALPCPSRPQPIHAASPFIFCPVGRGLDPSATFRPTPANGSPVGEEFIPPAHLPSPTSAAACGQAALRAPFVVRSVGRSLAPLRGVGDAAPYSGDPQGFSLPQTGTAAWGQAALHPTLPYSVGAGHARPATSSLPPLYLLPRREGS